MTPHANPFRPHREPAVSGDRLAGPWPPAVIEWLTIMQGLQTSGLLVGPAPVTDAVLGSLRPVLKQPVLERLDEGTPWDDRQQLSTLVLHDVLALSPREQRSLFAWMNGHGAGCRIVSVSCLPIFPLVEDGDFLAPLYYRLNVLYAEDRRALLVT